MIKIGDKVVCIKNLNGKQDLSIDKVYTVFYINPSGSVIKVINDSGVRCAFLKTHFITFEENRNQIINNILK